MNQDTITSAAAGASLTAHWWLPYLQDWSTVAGALLPILGAVWLFVQIATKIIETRRRRKDQ